MGKLLSVEEVNSLKESDKKYYVVWSGCFSRYNCDSIYKLTDGHFTDGDTNHEFGQGCVALDEGNVKIYEYEEDIKQYTTIEAAAKLYANNKLKFQALSFDDTNKVTCPKFLTSEEGHRLICTNESPDLNNNIYMDQMWILAVDKVEKEISFMGAIVALKAGKIIKSVNEEFDSIYRDADRITDQDDDVISIDEILNGTWFVVEN